jgi:hypothetical protein
LFARFAPKGHPRIRKTPFLAVEIFAHTDNVPAYPDILLGNEVDDVPEVDLEAAVDDGVPEARDTNAILAAVLAEDEGVVDDEDSLALADLDWTLRKAVAATVPWLTEPNDDNKAAVRRLLNATNFEGAGLLNTYLFFPSRFSQRNTILVWTFYSYED